MKKLKQILKNILDSYYRKKGSDVLLKPIKTNVKEEYVAVFPNATYSPWAADDEFLKLYSKVSKHTLVDVYRCYELWHLTKEVSGLDGDIIEVGVWQGGTGAILASAAQITNSLTKVFLCDTFEGVVKAGDQDNIYSGGEHSDTSVEIVTSLTSKLGLNNTEILVGIFPDDSADSVSENIFKLCHIDVDVYIGAKEITAWVWDRLVIGGMIVYDDYGFKGTIGVKKYVNENIGLKDRIVFQNLNGHAVIVKIS